MIEYEMMPRIETLLKININLSGDYYYTSKNIKEYPTVNIILEDGHYRTPDKTETDADLRGEFLVGIPKLKDELIVCKLGNDTVDCYNGKEEYEISMKQYKKLNAEKLKKSYSFVIATKNESIVTKYNKLMKNIELVKELSHGKIDLSRSGYLPQNEALKCLHYATQCFPKGDKITNQEEWWIKNGRKGALRCIKGDITLEKGYEYDIRGSYASQLSSKSFSFPMVAGEFKFIEELPAIRVEIQ
jgi:hypothetical protein